MIRRILGITFLFVSLITFGQLEIKPIPKWVKEVKMPTTSEVSKYDVNGGMYSTLVDYQSNLTSEETYTHNAYHIVSSSGVEQASQLLIEYDSSYTKIHFHYLYIWRKGKKIDRTQELTFETLNNEANLQANIYSGRITDYDILEDIRVGDKIEYAFTRIGQNPVYNGMQFKLIPLLESNPVDLFAYTIIYKDNGNFISSCNDCDNYQVNTTKSKEVSTTRIIGKNLIAMDVEEGLPSGFFPISHFTISSTKNWEEVNKWAMGIFSLDTKPKFTDVYEELFMGGETRDEKINAIIDYVQNDIRYMGIESGIGSIKPFHPEQVIRQRYGDCKDKSLLLAKLLNDIGIKKSYPVLVSADMTGGVDSLFPSGRLFDHCITYFEVDNKEYWIDPTFTLQGGDYKTRVIPEYKRGLVISEKTKGLKTIKNTNNNSYIKIKEIINIESFDGEGQYKVITNFYGLNADYIRNSLESISRKELTDQLKISHNVNFPNISTRELVKIKDDQETNNIELIEDYTIENYWNKKFNDKQLYNIFNYQPAGLLTYVSSMNCEPRKYPITVAHPTKYEQTATFHIPTAIPMQNELKKFNNDAFDFSYKIFSINPKTIKIDYNYKTNNSEISAESFLDACNDSNKIIDNMTIYISIPILD